MVFSERLVELRKKNNMTQEDLAAICDVSRQAVAKWESGDSLPDINRIVQIADFFNISLDELVRGKSLEKDQKTLARQIFNLFVGNIDSLRKELTDLQDLHSDLVLSFRLRTLIQKSRMVFPEEKIEEMLDLTNDFGIHFDMVLKKHEIDLNEVRYSDAKRKEIADSISSDIYKRAESLLEEYLDLH